MKTTKILLFLLMTATALFLLCSCSSHKVEYSINYELGGGTNAEQNPDSYTKDDITLSPPEKAGFDFLGWYGDASYTQKIDVISASAKADVTLYAKWSEAKTNTLSYNANGGLGYGIAVPLENGQTVTVAENPFERNGYAFGGWSHSPVGECVYSAGDEYTLTDTSARVLYAVWEKVDDDTSLNLSSEHDYDNYYVQDGLDFAVDFFGVSPERNNTHPLVGGESYNSPSSVASSRFNAVASNYSDFVFVANGIGISGGTAKILSPWCFEDWYADYKVKLGSGNIADMRTQLPSGDDVASVTNVGAEYYVEYKDGRTEKYKTTTQSNTTVYIKNTEVSDVTDYYIQNGKWAKKTYASKWGENCLILGENSTIFLDGLLAHINSGIEDYSVQMLTSFETEKSSGTVYMLGMSRVSVASAAATDGKRLVIKSLLKSYNGSGSVNTKINQITTKEKWYGVNDNTFTFDRDYTGADGKGKTAFGIYVNGNQYYSGTHETTGMDGSTKIGEGQSTKLYAIRVYSRVITEHEIKQNHFVDIAKLYKLDISRYIIADDEQKAQIHAAFADTSLDGCVGDELQKKLDSFFANESHEGLCYVEYKANYGGIDTLGAQYEVLGSVAVPPEMTLVGSEFLGWSDSPDGQVLYHGGEELSFEKDTRLYALWHHNEYTISYDTALGSFPEGVTPRTSYRANTDAFTLDTPVREGYVFCGWYADSDYKRPLEKIGYGMGENLTLVAAWTEDRDTLFELNLPDTLPSLDGKYDTDFTKNENVLQKFLQSVDALPKEVTVLSPLDVNSYFISHRQELFVSPDGDDKNSGAIDSPLLTVKEALSRAFGANGAVIWLRGGEYKLNEPIAIGAAHSGTPTSPLIISAYKDEEPILSTVKTISADLFEKPDYENDSRAARIPESSRERVKFVDLYKLGWTKEELGEISGEGTPSLFIDGEKMDIARYPNSGQELLYISSVRDTGSVTSRDGSWIYQWWMPRVKNWEKWSQSNGKTYDWDVSYYNQREKKRKPLYESYEKAVEDAKAIQAAVDSGARVYTDSYGNKNVDYGWCISLLDFTPFMWHNDGNIWYYGNVFEGWETGYYNIKEFNLQKRTMSSVGGSVYGATVSSNSPTGHNDYYLFNIIEALDTDGEWYLDYETGRLYIYTTDGFENAQISYSTSNSVSAITSNNANNVIINGLTVRMASGYGIEMRNGNNLVVQGCCVSDCDLGGIFLTGVTRSAAIYNDVSSVTGTMISMQNSSSVYTLTPTNNIVQNNVCHTPRVSEQSGISLGGCRAVVSHNTLVDARISFAASSECIVEYNEVRGGSKYESDAGMIYLNGYYHLGNHIRYNYMHDWGTPGNGVYFDDLSSNNYAYYNIIDTTEKLHEKATGFCYTSSGHYNVFYGNILVGRSVDRINKSALYFKDSASLGYRWRGLSEKFVTNFTTRYDSESLYARFPELEEFVVKMSAHVSERDGDTYKKNDLEKYLRSPSNNIVKNNIVVGTDIVYNEPEMKEDDGKINPHTDLVADNFHAKSYEGFFVDFKNGDFTLTSNAQKEVQSAIPDFVPLDASKCGITYKSQNAN